MYQGQELRQAQALFMSGQMRQSLHLLHLTNAELQAFLEEQGEHNPFLDVAPPLMSRDLSSRGSSVSFTCNDDDGVARIPCAPPPLVERLHEQLRLSPIVEHERLIGAALIEALDPAGRLGSDVETIATRLGCDVAQVEAVRQNMMHFEPTGLFALSLRECLEVQLAERGRMDRAMGRLLDRLDWLAGGETDRLARHCGVDAQQLDAMIAEIRRLDPKPGHEAGQNVVLTRVPDLLVMVGASGGWSVELNTEALPRVLLDRGFQTRLGLRVRGNTAVGRWHTEAVWLMRGLEQRCSTLLRVAHEILRRQDKFLERGVVGLVPMTLRCVADALGMHESTVSRAVAGKVIATPHGVLALRSFFSVGLSNVDGGPGEDANHSAESVRAIIRSLISAETPDNVLSDDQLVCRLRARGIVVARRTIAKYRDALNIPPSFQRRRHNALRGRRAA